jgi:uncharacterized membrane protein YfcA
MVPVFLVIGLIAGVASGLFGIGGGVLIVPALSLWAGFSQEQSIGTSLAVLLPPVGLAAVLEYYRHGNVNLKAALLIAVGVFVGAWLGAVLANRMGEPWLKLAFGVFVIGLGIWIVVASLKGLHTHIRDI